MPVGLIHAIGTGASARRVWTSSLTLLAVLALASGCSGNRHGDLVEFVRAHDLSVSSGQYVLMPPDEITIHAPVSSEVDGTVHRLRSDGKISLRLLGEVYVAGLTTEQVSEKIRMLLSKYYTSPSVTVDVTNAFSKVYYVLGEVARPGPKPYTGRDTLLSALAEASPLFTAWHTQVRVTRPSPDEHGRHTLIVDVERMVRAGNTEENFLLQEGDIVEVPPTPLAWVGYRVQELLLPIQPALAAYAQPSSAVIATQVYENGGLNVNNNNNGRGRGPFRR